MKRIFQNKHFSKLLFLGVLPISIGILMKFQQMRFADFVMIVGGILYLLFLGLACVEIYANRQIELFYRKFWMLALVFGSPLIAWIYLLSVRKHFAEPQSENEKSAT